MPTPDAFAICQRVAAMSGAGLAWPEDLVVEVCQMVARMAGPVVRGESADAALGLRPRPSQRRPATIHRQAQRDAALTALYHLTTGSQIDRGDTVLKWIAERRDGYPVEAHLVPHLDALLAAGIRIPGDASSVARIATAKATRAAVVRPGDDCGTVDPKVPPIAAHGHRT